MHANANSEEHWKYANVTWKWRCSAREYNSNDDDDDGNNNNNSTNTKTLKQSLSIEEKWLNSV